MLALIVLVAFADGASHEFFLSPFYLVPVALAGWQLGGREAIFWAVASAASWVVAQAGATPSVTSYWNGLGRLALLVVIGGGASALRTMDDRIRARAGTDPVARLAGDEFALLFPETGRGAAEVALRKIRGRLDEVARERDLPITFSVGAVICVGAPASVDRLIQRADALMYDVKGGGGNGMAIEVLNDQFGIEAILQRG